MKLVAYLRVSSETQLDGYGLDVQRQAITRWAKREGHKIVAWCVDEGVSGTTDAVDRPGLNEAITMLRRPPQVEGLVVAKLDRLARALIVQEGTLALIWREGGKAFTADSGEIEQDDPDDLYRTTMRQIMGVFAELDRRTVVKRLRDGRQAKAAAGRKAVGAYAYGYQGQGTGRDRDAAPNPNEQQAVALIVKLRKAGKSYRQIVAELDAAGIKPRRAQTWSNMSVRNIVLREIPPVTAS